jgi:hypothetical protein
MIPRLASLTALVATVIALAQGGGTGSACRNLDTGAQQIAQANGTHRALGGLAQADDECNDAIVVTVYSHGKSLCLELQSPSVHAEGKYDSEDRS